MQEAFIEATPVSEVHRKPREVRSSQAPLSAHSLRQRAIVQYDADTELIPTRASSSIQLRRNNESYSVIF